MRWEREHSGAYSGNEIKKIYNWKNQDSFVTETVFFLCILCNFRLSGRKVLQIQIECVIVLVFKMFT